ncbi:type II secretion system F family protein [Chryseosolibacter indicus]|uniref:Type II secretion system F family protein n=1 Tax=Chryseosolibacter indicus TaxID=2782351 RepID=A0ABS5VVD1_9BACT|nr:type II secretion system F family protein [Chryseosolibacter indicus]MBT1705384.1 type II secretion system F family protein [Chryseosolibacter indicus]
MSGINIKDIRPVKESSQKEMIWSLEKILETDIKLFSQKFNDKNKEAFYLELSTLLVAGLDIKSALELIEEEQLKKEHESIIKEIKENLINGDSLWEAMQKSSHFTPYEYFSVQIGEETGKLDIVLNQLYQYFNTKLKQRRQFVSALSYPVIILITSIGAVSFMLLFIVPMFSDVFKRFGGELPYLTRIIIKISLMIQSNFIFFFVLAGVVALYLYLNRDEIWMKKYAAKLIWYIPVVGKIVYSIQLARFCSSMSLLLSSKVPIIRSINLISQMVTFYPIQTTLEEMAKDVMNGESLHVGMSKHKIYSKRMVSLIKVGEEVNRLDTFFEKLSKQFGTDAEHQTSLLNTFLEPAMIIFLGLVVGFILLAMYLPMFEISTSIGG